MPTYTFSCRSKRHEDAKTRQFTAHIHHDEGKRVDQCVCPECGGLAKRDLVADLATVNVNGLTPISHASTGKGTGAHESQFMAGRFKKNPDGSVDKNHRPFRDTGEMDAYVNGKNDLGPPQLDDNGNPRRRKDGSMIRTGAKLVRYSANRKPSRYDVRKRNAVEVPNAWVDGETMSRSGATSPISLKSAGVNASRYKSPERRAQ